MAVRTTQLAERQRERCHAGSTPFLHEVELVTADIDNADDAVVLYFFGEEEAWLDQIRIDADDLDQVAGLVFDIGIGDADGVVDTVLISASTAGQAGAEDAAVDFFPVEVTGKYLILDITTAAASPTAGNIRFFGTFNAGLYRLLDDGTSTLVRAS